MLIPFWGVLKLKKNDGFILFETILALALLSGFIVFLFNSFSSSLRISKLSQERFQAALLLEGNMWELENTQNARYPRHPESSSIDNLEWKIRESDEDATRRINLSLLWGDTGRKNELSLSTYIDR